MGIGDIRAGAPSAAPGVLLPQRQLFHLVRRFPNTDPRSVLGTVSIGILPLTSLGRVTKLTPQFFCPV